MSPDITMCSNECCQRKTTCYRHTADPTPHWQSYSCYRPDEDGNCRMYWPTNDAENEKDAKK